MRWLVVCCLAFSIQVTANDSCLRGKWRGAFEALALRTCVDNLYYVIDGPSTPDPIGTLHRDHPDYDFGWRLEGLFAPASCARSDFRIAWTYFEQVSRANMMVSGPNQVLWPTLGHADLVGEGSDGALFNATATDRIQSEYYALDLDLGHWMRAGCRWCFRLFGGGRWAQIRFHQRVVYDGEITFEGTERSNIVTLTTKSWGLGPRIGIQGRLALCCGFGLHAQASTALFVGSNKTSNSTERITAPVALVDVVNEPNCIIFSAQDFRIGIDYSKSLCGCLAVRVAGGYEVDHYYRPLQRTEFVNAPQDGRSLQQLSAFDLTGFYVRGEVGF